MRPIIIVPPLAIMKLSKEIIIQSTNLMFSNQNISFLDMETEAIAEATYTYTQNTSIICLKVRSAFHFLFF